MKSKRVFILPMDGIRPDSNFLTQVMLRKINEVLADPLEMSEFVSHIKFNDAFHFPGKGMKTVLDMIYVNYPEVKVFYDLKLPDTNGTDVNILNHYVDAMEPGDIVTVSSSCSERAFKDIRACLPEGVKIALVSVLTDTSRNECRLRRGMVPEMAILNDAINLRESLANPFDAIVCSPAELGFLKKNLPPEIEFIVPGIRDFWMDAGQQSKDRINGVKEALDAGANFLVMGSQLTKGNANLHIDAVESRKMSIERVKASKMYYLKSDDPLQTLVNLKGFYQSPVNDDGDLMGPLVAYAGTYEAGSVKKNYVGDTYFNLSVIESHPQVLNYFATFMAEIIEMFKQDKPIAINALVGIPTGGTKIAQEVGRLLNIPGISLEKKVTAFKTETEKEKFSLHFRRNAGVIGKADKVILFEDLCNNFSTTEKAVEAVKEVGAEVVAIACVANRSKTYINEWQGIPIIAGISVPSEQYKQEDKEVAELIEKGLLSTDPKKDWEELKKAMKE